MNALDPNFNYINIPGLGGSGEKHWQTLWSKMNPEIINVKQKEWNKPHKDAWVDRINEAIEANSDQPVILIAHSLACIAVAFSHYEGKLPKIAGAFLTAPADSERKDFPKGPKLFSPIPRQKFDFPAIIVASENDPWCSIEKAKKLSNSWGTRFVNVGNKGHLTSESGIGTWEIGFELLRDFTSLCA